MATTISKTFTIVPLALTSLALTGFLFTTYMQQQHDYAALQEELNLTRNGTKQQLQEISEQASLRHSALVKMSEDVAQLRQQLETLEGTLKDKTTDLTRQNQQINGGMDRLDQTTRQQIRSLENIKTQLKERTDTYMSAMLKQEREIAKLSSEKAAAQAALVASASTPMTVAIPPTQPATTTLPPSAPIASTPAATVTPAVAATPPVPPLTPAPAVVVNTTPATLMATAMTPASSAPRIDTAAPSLPVSANALAAMAAISPQSVVPLRTGLPVPSTPPITPVYPDLRGAGSSP